MLARPQCRAEVTPWSLRRRCQRAGVALATAVALSLAHPAAACEGELAVSFGDRIEPLGRTDLSRHARRGDFTTLFPGADGARWVRFRFGVRLDDGDPPFALAVTDGKGRIIESYGPEDLLEPFAYPGETVLPAAQDGELTVWTGRIAPPQSGLIFDLWPVAVVGDINHRETIAMRIPEGDSARYSAADPKRPTWRPIETVFGAAGERIMRLSRSVGLVMPSYRQDVRACSGFSVARDVLITNWHCGWVQGLDDRDAWNDTLCKATLVDFSFDDDRTSGEYRCDRVLMKNKALDYVLLRIIPVDRAHRIIALPLAPVAPASGAAVEVIHHPVGQRKQLTGGCAVREAPLRGWVAREPTRFTHDCDTAPGSSGAPVVDPTTDLVVGLHHRGFERDETCAVTENPPRNKAISMAAILADIAGETAMIEERLGRRLELPVPADAAAPGNAAPQ